MILRPFTYKRCHIACFHIACFLCGLPHHGRTCCLARPAQIQR